MEINPASNLLAILLQTFQLYQFRFVRNLNILNLKKEFLRTLSPQVLYIFPQSQYLFLSFFMRSGSELYCI